MYTADQYARAKAQIGGAPPDARAILKERIGEYERYNPSHNAPTEGAHALSGETLSGPPQAGAIEPKLSHESETKYSTPFEAGIVEPPAPAPDIEDQALDTSLPNASKLKSLDTPPEYVAKNPLNGLKHIASATAGDPLNGPLANSYYEPSERQFQQEQGPLLAARGVQPGTPGFADAFAEYKDRKWAQAYEKAATEDRPLTRMEFVERHGLGWDRLKDFLANSYDTAGAFAKGLVAGRTLQGSKLIGAASDAMTGRDDVEADAAQADRSPWASLAGELKGASSGPLANVTKAATPFSTSASMGARIGGAAIGGAAAGEVDNLSRAVATGAGDVAHGRGLSNAKDEFVSHLLGAGAIGGVAGAVGHTLAEGANAYQKSVAADMPELAQLRRGGGDTDVYRGIRPGKAVAGNLEAAREPLPGEAKVSTGSTPTEVAVGKVREPMAKAHTDENAAAYERMGAEKLAAVEADQKLQEPVKARNAAKTAVDWVRSKLQPGNGYIPGMKLSVAQTTPGGDVSEAQKLAVQLYKPRLVTGPEAQAAAQANGGYVTTVEEAKRMGFDVGGLDDTGVPAGAPPIEEAVSLPKLLPKYPKGTDAGAVAHDITPEEAAAIQRYTWGKRQPGDADLVNSYLERAPASGLPHVYRGIAMKPDEAADMLASGSFNTGDAPASVSADPTVARSFAARNRADGDVGITFKLEGASARNVTPLAHEQVGGAEKELLLPPRRQFEIVSRHPDPANPGDWIVVARETAPEQAAGSTSKDIFGVAAEKPASSPVDRLKPRVGRAKPTAAPEVGSDWDNPDYQKARFDFIFGDSVEKDPFPTPKGDDITPTRPTNSPPIAERVAPPSRGAPSSPPPELRAVPSPQASQAQAAGLPPSEFKVVLEPHEYNAQKFEDILGDIDRKAGYAKKNGAPDPQWEKLAQAIREDRKQFGPGWTDLIAKHHDELNQLEQRSFHAGMAEDKAYPEMQGGVQARLQGKLKAFPSDVDSNKALRALADAAPPGVRQDLENLGATNAYQKLKGASSLKVGESIGSGGMVGRLAGVGGFLKPRADALARGLSAGPTGESTITPRLAAYVRANAPGPKWLPGVPALGGGALGLKAAVAYDALTPDQQHLLERLLSTVKKSEQPGATQ